VTTTRQRRNRQRGAGLAELVILTPVLLITMLGALDLGRLIYAHQVLTDLSREAANLVSRGASMQEAFAATMIAEQAFDLESKGGIVVSRVMRQSNDNATPWIIEQNSRGIMASSGSRVGALGGPATIPGITSLAPGVTITAVELVHSFQPIFGLHHLGLDFYPEVLYDAAFF